jgi:hypothetical protein
MGSTPRTDVALSFGADGSFRARLTSFPASEPAGTRPHHEIVTVSSPATIPAMRDAYLHATDAVDFGPIMVATRDPNVTVIGPAGGTATDSNNLVEVDIPAGARARRDRRDDDRRWGDPYPASQPAIELSTQSRDVG